MRRGGDGEVMIARRLLRCRALRSAREGLVGKSEMGKCGEVEVAIDLLVA